MKRIERNLLTSTEVVIEEAQSLIDIINHYNNESELNLRRRKSVYQKIGMGMAFIKALKMVSCDHNTKHGHTTGIAWIKDLNDNREIVGSYKEITKRCHNCNQVFYRKRYNLRKRKNA